MKEKLRNSTLAGGGLMLTRLTARVHILHLDLSKTTRKIFTKDSLTRI
ncbi:MAG: hypothetical protein IJQ56_07545 [Synergistaceae bacterium]|nr:hypothetical protein [Synergistaceae bacterium]